MPGQYNREVEGLFDLILCFVVCLPTVHVSVAMEENAHAVLWTNRVGYITLIAQLPGIYMYGKRPLSLGYALGLGSVYCHKSRATGQ